MMLTRTHLTGVVAAAGLALVLAACGGDDPGEPTGTDAGDAADAADEPPADPADVDADAGDAADDAGASGQATAEDGWSEPLDLPVPAPGTGVFTLEGVSYEVDITCRGPGVIPDEVMDGNSQLNEFIPFSLEANGLGEDADGRPIRVTVSRGIFIQGDRYLQIRNMEWGGGGILDIVNFANDDGGGVQQTPSSRDPQASELPLVRADPSGFITAEGVLNPVFETEEDSPTGPYTFAAQCQDTWPQDALP